MDANRRTFLRCARPVMVAGGQHDQRIVLMPSRCGKCGTKVRYRKHKVSYYKLVGHPWGIDAAEWWCRSCLLDAGYEVVIVCTHHDKPEGVV